MNEDLRRLYRWLGRSQPPPGALVRALLSSLVATATGVALLVGAVALLVESANRPGLRAVAGVLIVIELLAFLRSPIRYAERMSSHRLGFEAVARWRRWLMVSVGRWSFTRWRAYASGDLLERSLRDTDELQDLWLRLVIPSAGVIATAVVGDVVIAMLPPHGRWWSFALALALVQLIGLAGLLASFGPLVRADRHLRTVRGAYRATLVELSVAGPELLLLGAEQFVQRRSQLPREALERAERRLVRQRRRTAPVAIAAALVALALLGADHPRTSPTWTIVVALLALSTFDLLTTVRASLDTAVAVSAAAERLEQLDGVEPGGTRDWPQDSTLRATAITIREEDRVLVQDVTFSLAPHQRLAITGASGSGKSAMLRALGGLQDLEQGSLRIGDVAVNEIDEAQLRRHLVYVPSEPGLTRGYALDVVAVGRATTRDPVTDLAALGLVGERDTRWEELSRGERARVAMARAAVTDPAILLLDEPTSGLGADETRDLLEFLADTGASVLVATHDDQVIDWCDDVVELREGRLRSR
ncbi:MAG: ATP-binding cassette domain-containing protein [Acidimicrobiales bacterium]